MLGHSKNVQETSQGTESAQRPFSTTSSKHKSHDCVDILAGACVKATQTAPFTVFTSMVGINVTRVRRNYGRPLHPATGVHVRKVVKSRLGCWQA